MLKLRIPSPTRIKQTKPTRRPPPPSVQPPRRPDRLEVPTDGLDAPQDAVPLHLQLRVAATAAAAQAPCESEDRRQQGIWIRQSMFGRSDSLVNGGSEMPPSMIFRCANAPTRSTAAPLSGADDSLELHARSSSQRRLEHRPASATPRQPRLAVHQGGEFDLQPRLPRLSPLGEDAQDDPNSVNDLGGKDAHAGNEVLKGMGSCMDLKPRSSLARVGCTSFHSPQSLLTSLPPRAAERFRSCIGLNMAFTTTRDWKCLPGVSREDLSSCTFATAETPSLLRRPSYTLFWSTPLGGGLAHISLEPPPDESPVGCVPQRSPTSATGRAACRVACDSSAMASMRIV